MFASISSSRLKHIIWSIATGVMTLCVLESSVFAQTGSGGSPSEQSCQMRVNNTPEKLQECIQQDSLWNHLSQFQKIANHNKINGHGYRDTGTPGYKASVAYVAGLMRKAGYGVTIQTYQYDASEVTGVPQF